MPILLEICCSSIDDALEAEHGGADRVELCSALFLGGLTPSLGTLIEAKSRMRIPIMCMVRPRSGGFCYTDAEFATMLRDVQLAVEHGADGIVFGILTPEGAIDVPRTRRLRELIGNRQAVFHRAFDVTPDPFRSLEQLVDLGVTRILTSGHRDSVPEGAELIAQLIDRAGSRIEVLPGGGIAPWNMEQVIRTTRCSQVHLTAFKTLRDTSTEANTRVTFGGALYPPENLFQMTDRDLVVQLTRTVRSRP
jgi:copper homeostasis protein